MRTAVFAALLALGMAFCVPPAIADTAGIIAPQNNPHTPADGWQAGTCTNDVPDTPEECSVATPDQFFEDAAGHPQKGFTQFIVKHKTPGETPIGELKTVRVDLPVGLSVNPQATPQCPLDTFEANPANCAALNAQVGESGVTAARPGLARSADPRRDQSTRLQPHPQRSRTCPVWLRTGGQRRLSARPTSPGTVTTTRDSRSTSLNALREPATRQRALRRLHPEEPLGVRRALRRRHLHHHAQHLLRPRTARRTKTSTRPTCWPAPSPKRNSLATPSPRAPSRPSNPRCRMAKSRSTARAFPTSPRSASIRGPLRPTRRRV